jgi:hypothetical protein
MRRPIAVAALMFVLVTGAWGCGGARDSGDVPAPARHYATAAELRRCPFGHERLRDVPLAYGTLVPTPDYARRLAALEVLPGGCVIWEGMPRHRVACLACRYEYWDDERAWSRRSADPKAFGRPLDKVVTDFPRADGATVEYEQYVRSDGALAHECVFYYGGRGATLDLASRVNRYLQRLGGVRLEGSASQYPAGTELQLAGRLDDGRVVRYGITYRDFPGDAQDQTVSASFSVSQPGYVPRGYEDPK